MTSLSFNWNDTYIASGAANGDIILYNVVTAHGSQPMTTPDTQVGQLVVVVVVVVVVVIYCNIVNKTDLARTQQDIIYNTWTRCS